MKKTNHGIKDCLSEPKDLLNPKALEWARINKYKKI
jgi:hypothetical protein